MKSALVVLLFAASAFAQDSQTTPTACGPNNVGFEVTLNKTPNNPSKPAPDKAEVYFIQDVGNSRCRSSCLTTGIGIDGQWVGATADTSYFSISVDPGEHHLCAKSHSIYVPGHLVFAHFTAEAGKVYYFRARPFLMQTESDQTMLDLDPVDSDQARYLISSYPQSVSQPCSIKGHSLKPCPKR
jgi:hypothetical protein